MNQMIPYSNNSQPPVSPMFTLKEKVVLSLLAVGTVAVVVRLVIKAKETIAMAESDAQSFTDGNAATTAK